MKLGKSWLAKQEASKQHSQLFFFIKEQFI